MAHSNNIISKINVLGVNYDIHDAEAIHEGDLLQQLSSVMIFKGSVDTYNDLINLPTTTTVEVGHVYLVTGNGNEYVCTGTGSTYTWEELGTPLAADHTHSIAHTHGGTATVTGTNSSSSVTVTGENSSSSVSGSASVSVPKVTTSDIYVKPTINTDTFVKSYPGATGKLVTTSIKGISGSTTASKVSSNSQKLVVGSVVPAKSNGTAIKTVEPVTTTIVPAKANGTAIKTVTPTTNTVTGVQELTTTASKAVSGTAVAVATVDTAKTVVTGLGDSIKASVADGVLTLSKAEAVTTSITPAKSNGTITPYTFNDVTVPIKAESSSTFVSGISTSNVNVATVDTSKTVATGLNTTTVDVATVGDATNVVTGISSTGTGASVITSVTATDVTVPVAAASSTTVATGSLSTSGTGGTVITGLGTAVTGSALTSVSLASGLNTDTNSIKTGKEVSVGSETATGTISGTAAAQTWTQKTGTAAAQTWSQKTGTISTTSQSTSNSGSPNA